MSDLELSFSDLDDISFDDIFDDLPEKTHRHLTVDGTKIQFKTGLTEETRRLLLTTCSNLNFGCFSPTKGLVLQNKCLSDENSNILYRRMGFDFTAKYLLFQYFVETTSFGIETWRIILQSFGTKPGMVIERISDTNPVKKRRIQGFEDKELIRSKYILNTTKEVGDMLHGSLKKHFLTVGPDRGPLLCDVQYPGHDLVQKARLKCCLELSKDSRVSYCKEQLFEKDNIFEVVDCVNEMICFLELEDVIKEPPFKKVKVEISVSRATQDIRERPKRCYEAKFQKEEVKKEYEEIISKRKEAVKFQPGVWLKTCLVGGVFDYLIKEIVKWTDEKIGYSDILFVTVLLSVSLALRISTHNPRSKMDWIYYPVVLFSFSYFGLTDYVVTRWIGLIVHILTVCLLNYKWKLAWIPIVIAIILNWQDSWFSWISFIKIPFVFLSYWNQHRRKQKNPASILLSPYRDWLILVCVLVTSPMCFSN
tara:strand:+ start:246 stop:1679 length:1434 start_codon:yes stop_codon:yes gene_type:complete